MALRRKRGNERGFTLLEYCAGAAIIAGILWGALSTLGGSLDSLIRNIATWAQQRADEVPGAGGGS